MTNTSIKVLGLLTLLPLYQECRVQKPNSVEKIVLYAFPLTAFTKIPIDTGIIKTTNTLDTTIYNPNKFYRQFKKFLTKRDTINRASFRISNVRMYYEIYFSDNTIKLIIFDKSHAVLYDEKAYLIDEKLVKFISQSVPAKDRAGYMPYFYKPSYKRRKNE